MPRCALNVSDEIELCARFAAWRSCSAWSASAPLHAASTGTEATSRMRTRSDRTVPRSASADPCESPLRGGLERRDRRLHRPAHEESGRERADEHRDASDQDDQPEPADERDVRRVRELRVPARRPEAGRADGRSDLFAGEARGGEAVARTLL